MSSTATSTSRAATELITAVTLIEEQLASATTLIAFWIATNAEFWQEDRQPRERQPNTGTIDIKADR